MATALPLDVEAILHQLPGNFILLAPDNTILEASDEYLATTLKRREDVLGTNILDAYKAIGENEDRVLADSFERVRQTRKPYVMPLIRYDLERGADQGGGTEERYWEATNHPILAPTGELRYILRRTQDVTARVHAEQRQRAMQRELAESQDRALFVLQSLPVMVWTNRPDGEADYFNPRWLQFTGRPEAEEAGQGWTAGVHPEDRDQVSRAWQRAAAAGERYQLEYRLRNAEGQYRWVLAQNAPRRNADGAVTMWIGCATDIQDQKHLVEELLLANEEQAALSDQAYQAHQLAVSQRESFYALFMQAPALIAVLRGPEHRYEFLNPLYQELFPDRELLNRTVVEAIPEAVDQGFVGLLDHVYQTGEPYVGREVLFQLHRRDTGRVEDVYVHLNFQVLREHGATVGISVFAFEVTELVQARQKLEQLLNPTTT